MVMTEKDNRIKRFQLRFTDEEFKRLEDMEKLCAPLSKAEIIRNRLFGEDNLWMKTNLNFQQELNRVGAELGRSGNNINQLAKHANALYKVGEIPESLMYKFFKAHQEHTETIKQVSMLLRSVIRKGSK